MKLKKKGIQFSIRMLKSVSSGAGMRTFTASPLFAIPSLVAKPLIVDLDFALVSLPIKNQYLKRARWELL